MAVSVALRPFSALPLQIESFACTMSMMAFIAIIGPISRVLDLQPWQVGAAVTLAGVAWMLCARFWGSYSDAHGRRKAMLIGLGGFAICYALLCVFIETALRLSLPAMFAFAGIAIGRTAAGVFYSAVPVTSVAMLADNYPPDQRTKAIAGLGAANGVGMVIGPAMAGLMAPYGLTTPLFLIALLPLIAFIIVAFAVPRDTPSTNEQPSRVRILDPRLRTPIAVAVNAMICVSIAQITVGFYALDRLQLTPIEAARAAGVALGVVGVALVAAQLIVRALNWTPTRLIRVGGLISAVGFGATVFATTEPMLWACYFVAAAGMGLVFPAFSALAANAVAPHEQGAAAGAISSAQGLGVIVGPLLGTTLYELDARAPYVLVAILMIIATLVTRPATQR